MTRRLDPRGMTAVIKGRRYSVNTATLLAHNDYWDGNNFTKSGRNTWLYRTRGGAFFRADRTLWQGELDTIRALSESEAMELYDVLPVHVVEYGDAFGVIVEEASAGRPPLYDEAMKRVIVALPDEMLVWLRAQPDGISGTVRQLVSAAMAST